MIKKPDATNVLSISQLERNLLIANRLRRMADVIEEFNAMGVAAFDLDPCLEEVEIPGGTIFIEKPPNSVRLDGKFCHVEKDGEGFRSRWYSHVENFHVVWEEKQS